MAMLDQRGMPSSFHPFSSLPLPSPLPHACSRVRNLRKIGVLASNCTPSCCSGHRSESSSFAAPLVRHPGDVYTQYVCRTAEARHLERFIIGLLHDLEVEVDVQLLRQTFIVNVTFFGLQRYEHRPLLLLCISIE
jgi:hypothetical protein